MKVCVHEFICVCVCVCCRKMREARYDMDLIGHRDLVKTFMFTHQNLESKFV